MPRDRRERSWGWPELAIVVLLSMTVLAGLVIAAVVWFVSNINWAGWDF